MAGAKDGNVAMLSAALITHAIEVRRMIDGTYRVVLKKPRWFFLQRRFVAEEDRTVSSIIFTDEDKKTLEVIRNARLIEYGYEAPLDLGGNLYRIWLEGQKVTRELLYTVEMWP